jgi:hypothetical protein
VDSRVAELVLELGGHQPGASIDVRGFRDRIVSLHKQVETDQDRSDLLQAFFALMALVERSAVSQGQDAMSIRGLRDADHRLMLLLEAQIDGNVDPDLFARVTSREVLAGRLSANDEFHHIATAASTVMGNPRESQRPLKSFWGRIFGRD